MHTFIQQKTSQVQNEKVIDELITKHMKSMNTKYTQNFNTLKCD